ncbi:MAG: tRNA (adenosine(37)-N6)-threonylcarbamoyltransferase complex dimerization subunit type 1 TsaB, partial [Mucinivorans sp.]
MARILCIESGTEICSVALAVDGELISLRESEAVRNHIHDLALYVREILQENDLDPSDDIDAVAVGAGPGSYTGLRISGSTAKGLCYGMKKPLIAIDSLRCLAAVARQEYDSGILTIEDPSMALLVPMIDARRMEVYTAVYDMKLNELEPTSA